MLIKPQYSLNLFEGISTLATQVPELIIIPRLNHYHVRVLLLPVQFIRHTQYARTRVDGEFTLESEQCNIPSN